MIFDDFFWKYLTFSIDFFPDFVEDITADADDHLLHEVEQELRGTLLQNRSSMNIRPERSCQTESKSSILGVVPEEKDIEHLASKVEELEATVDQLTICIGKKTFSFFNFMKKKLVFFLINCF